MLKDFAARESSASSDKAKAAWIDKVRAKIRGNIVLPPEIQGNRGGARSRAVADRRSALGGLKRSSGVARSTARSSARC
jgi:hypothetical protein